MTNLTPEQVSQCRESVNRGMSLSDSLVRHVGGHALGGGLWRFFSDTFPRGGAAVWNLAPTWKEAWRLSADAFFAFGEDLFGNQLVIARGADTAMIWNHESGELTDLLLPPIELLETCLTSGLDWIDFYTPAVLRVGQVQMPVPDEEHLHWTTPLILGGPVTPSNTTLLDRGQHLVGHAELWRQLAGQALGAVVIPKTTPS